MFSCVWESSVKACGGAIYGPSFVDKDFISEYTLVVKMAFSGYFFPGEERAEAGGSRYRRSPEHIV